MCRLKENIGPHILAERNMEKVKVESNVNNVRLELIIINNSFFSLAILISLKKESVENI